MKRLIILLGVIVSGCSSMGGIEHRVGLEGVKVASVTNRRLVGCAALDRLAACTVKADNLIVHCGAVAGHITRPRNDNLRPHARLAGKLLETGACLVQQHQRWALHRTRIPVRVAAHGEHPRPDLCRRRSGK